MMTRGVINKQCNRSSGVHQWPNILHYFSYFIYMKGELQDIRETSACLIQKHFYRV
jgi:hypothetical protein